MINTATLKNVYFVGIGGIGMSALARYFNFIGKDVAGYDKTPTPLTEALLEKGMAIHFEDNLDLIPPAFKQPEHTLVIYTPAVPASHSELQFFKNNNFAIKKRAEVLGLIANETFCLAVAGTHGKTTTSCILAHMFKECKAPFTALVGGISENFNSNFVLDGTEYSVVEADEFDRSFLHLSPDIACVNSIDADHLDIYGTHEEMQKTYRDFTKKLKPNGKLFVRYGLPLDGVTFGLEPEADYRAENVTIKEGTYTFDIVTPTETIRNVRLHRPGQHHLLNALAAFAMAREAGFPSNTLVKALETFKGIQRRFSYQIKEKDFVFVDDYAHHPTEIDAVHQAIREAHPGKKITAIFQPHLFSRTQDFADDFAKSLSKFDTVWLLEIYPAREEPIPGVTSGWLLDKIENPNKKLLAKADLLQAIKQTQPEVLVTLGAGDIGIEATKIQKELAAVYEC